VPDLQRNFFIAAQDFHADSFVGSVQIKRRGEARQTQDRYAVENSDGQSFIAMELLEGQSLDHKLLGPPLPLVRLLDISIQLTEALEAAHAKGIVHRDIKPANVFITQRGQVKVLDFVLAKLTRDAEMAMDTVASQRGPAHLTSPRSTVGTVAYMSPEQALGEDLDARSDLFSFGAVMYQMATGRLPFTGATSAVIFTQVLMTPRRQILSWDCARVTNCQRIYKGGLGMGASEDRISVTCVRSQDRRVWWTNPSRLNEN
jgi:serine/threonine protein kinase